MPNETNGEPNKIVPSDITVYGLIIACKSLYTCILLYSHNITQFQTLELVAPWLGLLQLVFVCEINQSSQGFACSNPGQLFMQNPQGGAGNLD